MTMLDPWQRKPVRGAVFEVDNFYHVSNDAGLVSIRRDRLNASTTRVLNLPDGFYISPELNTLPKIRSKQTDLTIVRYASMNISFRKMTYARISPRDVGRYPNIGLFNNELVNINDFTISHFSDRIEIGLRDVNSGLIRYTAFMNTDGRVVFDRIVSGRYEVVVNPSSTDTDLVIYGNHIINVGLEQNVDVIIGLRENYTEFVRFE